MQTRWRLLRRWQSPGGRALCREGHRTLATSPSGRDRKPPPGRRAGCRARPQRARALNLEPNGRMQEHVEEHRMSGASTRQDDCMQRGKRVPCVPSSMSARICSVLSSTTGTWITPAPPCSAGDSSELLPCAAHRGPALRRRRRCEPTRHADKTNIQGRQDRQGRQVRRAGGWAPAARRRCPARPTMRSRSPD